jgi:RING finger protein 113A
MMMESSGERESVKQQRPEVEAATEGESNEFYVPKFAKKKDTSKHKNIRKRWRESRSSSDVEEEEKTSDTRSTMENIISPTLGLENTTTTIYVHEEEKKEGDEVGEEENYNDDRVDLKKFIRRKVVSNPTLSGNPSLQVTNKSASKAAAMMVTYDASGSALPLGPRDQGAAISLAPSELDEIDRSKRSTTKGPVRAAANVRFSVRFDYQPDVCKDYKETGYCGFGDSCIFLHDRGDYKSGWQLDREWEATKKMAEETSSTGLVISNGEDRREDDELPFACFLCREEFSNPIMTKCKHYFCEKCFLLHYKKSSKCPICGVQTMGIFSPAKELALRLEERKAKLGEQTETDVC